MLCFSVDDIILLYLLKTACNTSSLSTRNHRRLILADKSFKIGCLYKLCCCWKIKKKETYHFCCRILQPGSTGMLEMRIKNKSVECNPFSFYYTPF